jgi:hypothetical protein
MAIDAAHVSVAANGDIRWTGAAQTYTVLELHRFLQAKADDQAAAGNDLIDITNATPSVRSTDNIIELINSYNIDAEMAQHLYDGSITQDGGDEVYSGLVVVGAVNLATTLMIVQNGGLYDDGVHTPATPFWGTGLNADAATATLMRCMILTRTGGTDVDNKKVLVAAREYGDTYAEFSVTLGLGNSTAAIFTGDDLNNSTAAGTVATWSTITNESEGWNELDLGNGNGDREYYSEWNRDTYTINQLYERAKWLQRRGNTTNDIYGLDGELFRGITHEIDIDTISAQDWDETFEPVSWTGGTGQLLAVNDVNAPTKMWIQLLTGSAPTDGMTITGGTSTATADVNTTVTTRTLSPCFLGQSTGSALIGAYGIGVEVADVTNADKLFDLTNTLQVPPNNVTFTVTGLVSGEDYVLVTNDDGTDIDYDQMALNGALTGAAVTTVTVSGSIPADTPSTGTIRIERDSGVYSRHPYSAWSGSDFTITSHDFSTDNAATTNNVFISYIDKLATGTSEAFTTIYDSARTLFVRVRDGDTTPIKTFESPASLGSAGGGAAAIRTSDA